MAISLKDLVCVQFEARYLVHVIILAFERGRLKQENYLEFQASL